MFDKKKFDKLLSECDLAEADMVGQVKRRTGSPKQSGSYLILQMNGASGDVSVQTNNLPLNTAVGTLLRASINLIRANQAKLNKEDIHETLEIFTEVALKEVDIAHTKFCKNENKHNN